MRSAVIVDAVRTPTGRRGGGLSGWLPADLAAVVLQSLVERNDLDPSRIDDVILGCVHQVGAQAYNVARNAVLAAGWPETVPGTTVDRQCGSSQQALHFAAQGVLAGSYDVVVAGGIEVMSLAPLGASLVPQFGDPFSGEFADRYADRETFGHHGLIPQGLSAELLAERWGLSRDDLDAFGLRSQQNAAAARDAGRFEDEIVALPARRRDRETGAITADGSLVSADEGIRPTTIDGLAGLKPAFLPTGRITAGTSSQISDGAAALLVMAEDVAEREGFEPLARVSAMAVVGDDPVAMLSAPIPATRAVLDRAGLTIDDIDLFEVNEAFASVVLGWQHELAADPDRVNVNGGAIALGHPLGASGARITATLLHELRRTSGHRALQTMCEGGGMANATVFTSLA